MTNCETLIADLHAQLSIKGVKPGQVKLGDDPGLAVDLLSAFDIQGDDNGVSYTDTIRQIAESRFPSEFNRCEYVACGSEEKATSGRLIKLKTRLYYKQLKFNLLREETEGYSKTIAELFSGDKYNDPARTLSRLQKLIGQFNLDPNRVVDIVLDCFEASPEHATYYNGVLEALQVNRDDLSDILKRKFVYQEKVEGSAFPMCKLAAVFCESGLIDTASLFAFIEPQQSEIKNLVKRHIELVKARSKKAEVVITVTTVGDVVMSDVEDDSKTAAVVQPFYMALGSQLAEDAKLADNFYDDNITFSKNMKLGLICALLERGSWDAVQPLLVRVPAFAAVHLSPRIQKAIATLIDHSIRHLHDLHCNDKFQILATTDSTSSSDQQQLVPSVQTWAEFVEKTVPMISQLGPYIAVDLPTAFKLLRVVIAFFKNYLADNKDLEAALIGVVDQCLLPALSLLDCNYAYSDELWGLMSLFPYQLRFWLYNNWRGIHTTRFLEVQRAMVSGRTKYSLKRLSKDTVKLIGRQLGKLAHIHPFAVFSYLLGQVQVYVNLILPVVDSLRFLSQLELDVLTFTIIDTLASPDKGHLKTDDGSLSMWVVALSTFIGAFYRKYPSDLTAMLQFIVNELRDGNSTHLLILREVVSNMSGIDVNANLTEDGVHALAGGELLKQEIFHTAAVRSSKRLSNRLKEALSQDDILPALFILMAQHKERIVHVDAKELPLKLTGQFLDACRDTFIQFNNFLQFAFKPEDLQKILPGVTDLIQKYHLPIEAVMHFWRESLMRDVVSTWKDNLRKLRGTEEEKVDDRQSLLLFIEGLQGVLTGLEGSLKTVHGENFFTDLEPRLYAVFWLLDLGDLQLPSALYEKQITKLKVDRAEAHETSTRRKQKEDKTAALERKLKEEFRFRQQHIENIHAALAQQVSNLFPSTQVRFSPMNRFLQTCVFRRAMFSEVDAVYCAKFLELLHSLKTHNIQTLLFLDRIFCDAVLFFTGLTETESHSLGTFYRDLLAMALRWHDSTAVYERECVGFPMYIRPSTEEGELSSNPTYDEYRSICYKWHFRLTKTFDAMLGASYVSRRNALIILTKVQSFFPAVQGHFDTLLKAVEKCQEEEKNNRRDISLMAASYATQLKKRQPAMVSTGQFYTPKTSNTERAARKKITISTKDADEPPPKKAAMRGRH